MNSFPLDWVWLRLFVCQNQSLSYPCIFVLILGSVKAFPSLLRGSFRRPSLKKGSTDPSHCLYQKACMFSIHIRRLIAGDSWMAWNPSDRTAWLRSPCLVLVRLYPRHGRCESVKIVQPFPGCNLSANKWIPLKISASKTSRPLPM